MSVLSCKAKFHPENFHGYTTPNKVKINKNIDYEKLPSVISNILLDLDYNLESALLNGVVEKYRVEIISIYQILYR